MSLRRRWAFAFATMAVLGLVTAATSLVAMTQTVDRFRAAAVRLDRETATAAHLRSTVEQQFNAAHGVIDRRTDAPAAFLALDRRLQADLARAPGTYGRASERRIVGRLQAEWQTGLALPRRLAAVAPRAPEGADRRRDIATHEMLNRRLELLRTTFGRLEAEIRLAHRDRLEAGGASRDRMLLVLLTAVLGSALALVVFARRMAREVVTPIRQLREAWLDLGAGRAARRVAPHRDDELGELVRTFNAMAEALETSRAELADQATRDALTGLPNRHALAGATGGGTVVFVDLDDFKAVNDSLGHHAGDELLREVARRLEGCTRATDMPVRLGGDEFAVVLAGCDHDGAERLADRILLELSVPFTLSGTEVNVGASIGIASAEDTADGLDQALRRADAAMYAAKKGGKRRWVAFDPAVH
jgi:diguanylate cyclase (GGDEF)-like protein